MSVLVFLFVATVLVRHLRTFFYPFNLGYKISAKVHVRNSPESNLSSLPVEISNYFFMSRFYSTYWRKYPLGSLLRS